MLFPWVHLIMKDDNEARSFTTGGMVSEHTETPNFSLVANTFR
jgi:hypothetical protein